jgi:hypothetical protein
LLKGSPRSDQRRDSIPAVEEAAIAEKQGAV